MSKVKLTIIKDNSVATIHPNTEIVQNVELCATGCADSFTQAEDATLFQFGKAIVYTHGVQVLIFEDVVDE